MSGITITATDTDAGKTYITCLLIKAFREQGRSVIGYKPVACGDRKDARLILDASSPGLLLDEVNPLYLKNSTSPYVASLLESAPFSLTTLIEGARTLESRAELLITEGVGGWEVPLTDTENFSHLAHALGYPTILIVNNKLGMLNHAILTANAIKAQNTPCLGIIINTIQEEWDTATLTNRGVIEQLTGLPILAELINGQDFIDITPIDNALATLSTPSC